MKKTKFIAAALAVLFVFNAYALPRSKAVVIDATAAFGAAAATAAINGTTATTLFTGMSTSAATTTMTTLMGEYATATGAAASGSAFAASIGASAVVTAAGALVIGAAAGYALFQFINWLRQEKGLEAGGGRVSVFDSDFYFSDGSPFYFVPSSLRASDFDRASKSGATELFFDTLYEFPSGFSFEVKLNGDVYTLYLYNSHSYELSTYNIPLSVKTSYFVTTTSDVVHSSSSFYCNFYSDSGTRDYASTSFSYSDIVSSYDFSLQPKPEFQTIPQEIPDGQAMVISGIENLPQADSHAAADFIMQTAIDGNLSPTVTVEADPTVTPDPDPDPDPEPTPPPDDLPQNLPQLGDVLTSRFPFSIPWDIGRVLDFLSAEPVAPHVEFQPFKGDLFGIPADSVSVDYDFSKHEDIASFCRTFEIVGFCLLLAVGTKRLIWTA